MSMGERYRAKIESWEPRVGQQVNLGQQHGIVVRIYDHEELEDGKPKLVHDTEVMHGQAGIFGDSTEASDYADRVEQAWRERSRLGAEIHEQRQLGLEAAQAPRFVAYAAAKAKEAAAKAEAKAAKAEADAAQAEVQQLHQECAKPSLAIDCPLRGEGYRIILAPSLTDGTQDEPEGRTLVNTIPDPKPRTASRRRHGTPVAKGERSPIDDALEATEAAKPRRGKGKKAPPRPEATPKLPTHVPDVSGLPLRVGSRVEIPGLDVKEGRLTEIRRQDPDGAFIVEVEDDQGLPREVASVECCKIEGREGDDPAWPE